MNCTECRENLTAHLEGLLDPGQDRDVTGHLDSCSACSTEAALQSRLRERLVKNGKAFAQAAMAAAVMDRISSRRASELRRIAMHRRLGKMGLGLAAAAAITAALFVPWDGGGTGFAPKNKIEWVVDDVDAALERAKAQGKPALIYFTADWCIPCKEYKASTFTDPDVLKDFQRFVAIKADITKVKDPKIKKLTRRFKIFGPPVFIFVTSSGEILEAQDQRVEGFFGPQDFLQRLRQIG